MKKLILLISFIATSLVTQANIWVVDSLNDSGLGSLRAVADSVVSGDTIRFNPNLIALGSDSIVLTTGEIAFDSVSVVIKGLYTNQDTLFISGNDSSRIFMFHAAVKVVIDSVVIRNGSAGGFFAQGRGGAVFCYRVDSTIVLNSKICESYSFIAGGGLAYEWGGNSTCLIIQNSLISGNTTGGQGGGIYSQNDSLSFIHIINSTISGNVANTYGGGVWALFDFVRVLNSTISGNSIINGGAGAGISCKKKVLISGSTISSNIGGGVYAANVNDTCSVSVLNSTISLNTSTSGNNAGIGSVGSPAIVYVAGTIIANNGFNLNGILRNGTASLISGGYNIFSGTVIGAIATDSINVTATQLNLQPLGFNGGATRTMLPGLGSIVIDNGDSNDTSSAQNKPIWGVRDRGAAEFCPEVLKYDTVFACNSYTWRDGLTYYLSDSTSEYTYINPMGCDSVFRLRLTILPSSFNTDSISTCDSYTWIDGITYTENNYDAQHILINSQGCDSIVTLHLLLINTNYQTVNSCSSYTWRNGVTYSLGNYFVRDTVSMSSGCDSIYILDLSVYSPEYSTDSQVICDSLTWLNGVTYYSSTNGVYDTLVNRNGCDSIVNLDLTVNPSYHDTDYVSACLYYIWSNGQIYVMDNDSATQNFAWLNGCDSIIHLDLTIHQGTFATDTHVVCDSLVWINGNTYYANNTTATFTMVGGNINGCDSVVTLNLTVNNSQTTDVISSCASYTWIDGVIYTSSNNLATYSATNSLGCDSTITLDLTISNPTNGIHVVSVCNNYTWNGITYTSSNNTAQDTLVNAGGCDSIITLNLTILNPSQFTDVISSCNPITWLDGNTYSTTNTTATHVLVNSVGCDSVVTLDFAMLQATSATDVITSCIEITWIDGIVYSQTISGPMFTIPNSNGCDSVITLDFTLLEVDTTVTRNYLTLTAQATNARYQWIDCNNGAMAGETSASFTATVNGSYQVAVTQNGCVDTSACFTIANVGVQDIELIGVTLYPNPTSDVLNIDKGSNASLEITITNSVGGIVHQSHTQNQMTTINMAKMATGMYVVTLKNELGVKVERVVKR